MFSTPRRHRPSSPSAFGVPTTGLSIFRQRLPLPQPATARSRPHPPFHSPPRALLDPSVAAVLSHHEAAAFLSLQPRAPPADSPPQTVTGSWSTNLGRDTLTTLTLTAAGIILSPPPSAPTSSTAQVTFGELAKMSKKNKVGAYQVYVDALTAPDRVAGISALTQRTASLAPHHARAPPTVTLGGFGMHRFANTDPGRDTAAKVAALARVAHVGGGAVLDVCTGLGYTAIALAGAGARAVVTVELDPVVEDVSSRNPWSEGLFTDDRIVRKIGDACDVLQAFEEGQFCGVVHDPPAQAMGGELYSLEFYKELKRVLKPGGGLFHYIGDPGSAESGRLFRGVKDRLVEAGFQDVQVAKEAFGVTATAAWSDAEFPRSRRGAL